MKVTFDELNFFFIQNPADFFKGIQVLESKKQKEDRRLSFVT